MHFHWWGSFPSLLLNWVAGDQVFYRTGGLISWCFLWCLNFWQWRHCRLRAENGELGKVQCFYLVQLMGKDTEERVCLWKMLIFHFLFLTPNVFICWVIKENKFCLSSLYLLSCQRRVLSTKKKKKKKLNRYSVLAQIALITWIYVFFKVPPNFYTCILC